MSPPYAPRTPKSRYAVAFSWIGMALGAWVLLAQPANAADDHWITDAKGCKVLNSDPQPKESITWSGACIAGYAEGPGQLSWMQYGKAEYTFDGALHAGRMDGPGTQRYANGDRYEGEFYADRFDGHGVFTFDNGNRYEGDFVKGMSTRQGTLTLTDGQQFKTDLLRGEIGSSRRYLAPAAMFVVCFSSSEKLESLTLVRSSGHPTFDDRATEIIKLRDRIGVQLVKDPIPGCHMVGAMFTSTDVLVFSSRY